jgi:hypothetical protein
LPELTHEPLRLLKMEGMLEKDNTLGLLAEGMESVLDNRQASLNIASGEDQL